MEVLLSKFIEDPDHDLTQLSDSPIQLAFYRRKTFRDFDHQGFKANLARHNIRVESVHAPAADIYHSANNEFINTLKTIKKHYGVRLITIHPQRGQRRQAKAYFKKMREILESLDIILAYETFEGEEAEKKWIYQLRDMHNYFCLLDYPFLGITYDFAHGQGEAGIREVEDYSDLVRIIHFSDALKEMPPEPEEHHQHLPLGMGEYPVIPFLDMLMKIGFKGYLIIEYWDQYHHLLKKDARAVNDYIRGKRSPCRL